MKKLVFKRWVDGLIILIQFLMIVIMASEVEDTKIFIVSKLIAMLIFILLYLLMIKYSRLCGE